MKFPIILMFAVFSISCQSKVQTENNKAAKTVVPQNINLTEKKTDIFPINVQVENFEPIKDLNSKFGNIQSGKQTVCLKIQNKNLKVGDKIQFVLTDLPQEVFETEIAEKAPCVEKGFGTLDMGYITDYLLRSSDRRFLNRGFGIGVVTEQKIILSGKLATADIDNDNKPEYFRECTSMEGLHLTVWSGKPLKGRIIWHSYYGLGYDTEPTCKDKDFKGLNDEDL